LSSAKYTVARHLFKVEDLYNFISFISTGRLQTSTKAADATQFLQLCLSHSDRYFIKKFLDLDRDPDPGSLKWNIAPLKKISYEFTDNLLSYQAKFVELPSDKNSCKEFLYLQLIN